MADLTCPTCGKVFPHVKPDTPVVHVSLTEHRIDGYTGFASPVLEDLPWMDPDRKEPQC
jgi:hypothetical protein